MTEKQTVTDEDVDRALRGMRDYFRKSLAELQLDENELKEFFRSLINESPRALAIVSFSYIDEKLATIMQQHMNPDILGGLNSLFKSFGPLSTASARIKIAASLHWLSPSTYQNLELLRKIRNEFAHSPFLNGFDESPVRDFMDQFAPMEKALWGVIGDGLMPYESVSRRQLYHLRATLTCARMIEEINCSPKAISMGLPPHSLHMDGSKEIPRPFIELMRAALEVVSEVVPKAAS